MTVTSRVATDTRRQRSDVVVITSGIARKPGMSRDDLLRTNMGIVRSVTEQAVQQSPDAISWSFEPTGRHVPCCVRRRGFSARASHRYGGVLDSARFRTFIAEATDVSVEDVSAMVLGGHGDTMVPISRYSTVAGVPITQILEPSR